MRIVRNCFFSAIMVFGACSQADTKSSERQSIDVPNEIVLLEGCQSIPETVPCLEVAIPNQCKDGVQEKGFCANWDRLGFERPQDSWLLRGAFEMDVSGQNFTGPTKIISHHIGGHPCGSVMQAGFLGYDADSFPVFAADIGAVSLQTDQLIIGYSPARIVINPARNEIAARYLSPNDNSKLWSFSFSPDGQAYLSANETCYRLPNESRELAISDKKNCKARQQDGFDAGTIPASNRLAEQAKSILSKEMPAVFTYLDIDQTGGYRVRQIRGADLIVIDLFEACS